MGLQLEEMLSLTVLFGAELDCAVGAELNPAGICCCLLGFEVQKTMQCLEHTDTMCIYKSSGVWQIPQADSVSFS